jgi:H/ACA ribonucleoprotein complex subunit 4
MTNTALTPILTRKEEETNPNWGCVPEKRPIEMYISNGLINLDKPAGPTSHQVSAWVKCIFNSPKAGHGGTLDPAVTGVLPVAINNATKVVSLMLRSPKEYIAIMHLHGEAHEGKVMDVMKQFVGSIKQSPPKRSNVKRVEREREIYELEFLGKKDRDVLFRTKCQHGTYIRRLCEDLGNSIGTRAHMTELRRTKAGGFSEDERLVTLQDLADAYAFYKEDGNEKFLRYCIRPLEIMVKNVPKVWIFDATVNSLCHGAKLAVKGISKVDNDIKSNDTVAVMSLKDELVGLGTALMGSEGMVTAESGLAVKMERIILKEDTYPSMWKKKEQDGTATIA